MYYVISLKHTHKQNKYITLWRPNNRGYCYAQDQAGQYPEYKDGYHNTEGDSTPIEVSQLDGFFIDAVIDGKPKKAVPNCKQVWEMLGFKMTNRGLVINPLKTKTNE